MTDSRPPAGPINSRAEMLKRVRRAAYLSFISAAARAPGFLIPLMIAAYYGAGASTDAYFIAYSAALLVGGTLAQGIDVAIVPFAARAIASGGQPGRQFLDYVARRTTLVAGIAWLVGLPLAVWASRGGLRAEVSLYGVCFAPLVMLWNTSSVYSGGLVSQDSIGFATGSTIWRGVGGLTALLLAPREVALTAVAVGLGAGELVRTWLLRATIMQRLPGTTAPTAPDSQRFGAAAAAQVFAGAAGGSAPVVERFLAASIGTGAVSRLEYSSRLLVVPGLVFDGALAPLLLSRWSQSIAARGRAPGRLEVLGELAKGMGVALVIGALIYALAGEVVELLLSHGRFTDADAIAVTSLLRLLAVGYVGSMGALLMERYYLASAKNRLLAAFSIGRLSLRVGTALLLLPSQGLLAFGFGFAAAEYGYLAALIALLPAPTIDPVPSENLRP